MTIMAFRVNFDDELEVVFRPSPIHPGFLRWAGDRTVQIVSLADEDLMQFPDDGVCGE